MNEKIELIKNKEINFLKELDNSVIRFKHSLPHHNDSLLNRVLVEKFIAQSKIDFYEEYKSVSSQYNYIYTKNKLVEERCDEIIQIFQDMENDMSFLMRLSKILEISKEGLILGFIWIKLSKVINFHAIIQKTRIRKAKELIWNRRIKGSSLSVNIPRIACICTAWREVWTKCTRRE